MKFQTAITSNLGGRNVNQDYAAFLKTELGGCWALADGLGGYHAGEIASKLAVETILQQFQQTNGHFALKYSIDQAHEAIQLHQKSAPLYRSMKTTIVVLSCINNRAIWAHVGDSRLYHIRQGQVISQTKDHSVCQALVNAGEITTNEIRFHEDRNRLTRVLGSNGNVKATIQKEEVFIQSGDAFLLCSDGFWEYVTEEEMESTRIRVSTPSEWLQLMEAILAQKISENNDNYSAIAMFVTD